MVYYFTFFIQSPPSLYQKESHRKNNREKCIENHREIVKTRREMDIVRKRETKRAINVKIKIYNKRQKDLVI